MIYRAWNWVGHKRATLFPEGSLRARLAGGAFWSLTGAIISQSLGVVTSIATARALGQVGFGEFGIISSTVILLGTLGGLGLGTTATKYIAEFRVLDPARAGKILGICIWVAVLSGGIVSLVSLILTPWLAVYVLNAPHLVNELRLGCGLIFFSTFIGLQIGVLAGFEAFLVIARVNLICGLLNLFMVVSGVWLFGLIGAVGALVLVSAASSGFYMIAVCRESRRNAVKIIYCSNQNEWQIFWKFSLPAFLSSIMVVPVNWIGNVMLVNQLNGYQEMGIFNAANQWRNALTFFLGSISQITLPILSSLYSQRHIQNYRKVLLINLLVVLLINVLLATPIILLSNRIMLAYGSDFYQGSKVLILMVLTTIISSSLSVLGYSILSMGKMWHGLLLNFIWASAFVIFVYLFINSGANGLAWGYFLSYITHLILVTFYVLTSMIKMPVLKNVKH